MADFEVIGPDHVGMRRADVERSLAFHVGTLSLEARFPDGSRLDGLYRAQGYASSLYVQDSDDNTVEPRSYR